QLAFHRRRLVLGTWLLLIGLVVGLHLAVGSSINNQFTIPGSQSQTALNTLSSRLPAASGTSAQIVLEAPLRAKITASPYRAPVEAVLSKAKPAPQVAAVIDPYQTTAISPDGRTALAQVQYAVTQAHLASQSLPALEATTTSAKAAGLTVDVGGSAY